MSAFDKVKDAQQRAEEAQKSYNARQIWYEDTVNRACEALADGRVADAKKTLEEMMFSKSGESQRAYEKLWSSAVPLRKDWSLNDGLDVGRWELVREFAPIDATANIKDFFGRALQYGSAKIITDLVPLYDKAAENWHYNWSGGDIFVAMDVFKGREDQLLERLKVADILVSEGAPPSRLDEVMIRICQFANASEDLGLSSAALNAMSKTYVGIMNRQLEESRTHFFDPMQSHMAPPQNLVVAHEEFTEKKNEVLGEQKKRPSPRP